MEMPLVQYHATTLAAGERILKEGLKLPPDVPVATHRFRIPTVSTTDEPHFACSYHPDGALVTFMVQGDARYLNRTIRNIRKGENLEAAVNRWLEEARDAGASGIYVGKGLQSTAGNQTLVPRALEVVNVTRCRSGRATLEGASFEVGEGDVYIEPPSHGQTGELTIAIADAGDVTSYYGTPDEVARYLERHGFADLAREVKSVPREGLTAYIAGLEVAEDRRGQGIGTALMREALARLERLGVRHFFVHASPTGGLKNIDYLLKFYDRFGFQLIECCPRDVWPVIYRRGA